MLGKYIKYETKASGKMMLLLSIILAGVTVFEAVISAVGMSPKLPTGPDGLPTDMSELIELIVMLMSFVYILTLFAIFMGTFIYLCMRFYRTMYSAQGYLTHTLPISSIRIFHVKILVSFAWLLFIELLTFLSVFAVASVFAGGVDKLIVFVGEFNVMDPELGMNPGWYFLMMLVSAISGSLCYLLMFFAGFSVGQLSKANKGAFGFAASIGFYFLSQIISFIVGVILILVTIKGGADTVQLAQILIYGSGGMMIVQGLVYYCISRRIVGRHLNLE